MKFIISLALLLSTLSAGLTYSDMYGIWEISPINARTVVFGNVHSETSITAEFLKGGKVLVEDESYYWAIENGLLLLSTNPPRKAKLYLKIDQIQMSGQINDCIKTKIIKKGIAGYYNKKDFMMCKMRDEPLYIKPRQFKFKVQHI